MTGKFDSLFSSATSEVFLYVEVQLCSDNAMSLCSWTLYRFLDQFSAALWDLLSFTMRKGSRCFEVVNVVDCSEVHVDLYYSGLITSWKYFIALHFYSDLLLLFTMDYRHHYCFYFFR